MLYHIGIQDISLHKLSYMDYDWKANVLKAISVLGNSEDPSQPEGHLFNCMQMPWIPSSTVAEVHHRSHHSREFTINMLQTLLTRNSANHWAGKTCTRLGLVFSDCNNNTQTEDIKDDTTCRATICVPMCFSVPAEFTSPLTCNRKQPGETLTATLGNAVVAAATATAALCCNRGGCTDILAAQNTRTDSVTRWCVTIVNLPIKGRLLGGLRLAGCFKTVGSDWLDVNNQWDS